MTLESLTTEVQTIAHGVAQQLHPESDFPATIFISRGKKLWHKVVHQELDKLGLMAFTRALVIPEIRKRRADGFALMASAWIGARDPKTAMIDHVESVMIQATTRFEQAARVASLERTSNTAPTLTPFNPLQLDSLDSRNPIDSDFMKPIIEALFDIR